MAMIALDMGASEWRAMGVRNGEIQPLRHRFVGTRWEPFLDRRLLQDAGGQSIMEISVNSYKRYLGKRIGHGSDRQDSRTWLARRLAALHEDACRELGVQYLGIVIPLPSCFRDLERWAVINAAKDAGFIEVETPDESTLVVNDFALRKNSAGPIIYFHLGASTLAIGCFARGEQGQRLAPVVYDGTSLMVGGHDFDGRLMEQVLATASRLMGLKNSWDLRRFVDMQLHQDCERAKEKFTIRGIDSAGINVERLRINTTAKPLAGEFVFDRRTFQATVTPVANKANEITDVFVNRLMATGLKSASTILIGGAAACGMPFVWSSLASKFDVLDHSDLLLRDDYVEAAARFAMRCESAMRKSLAAQEAPPSLVRTVTPYDPASELSIELASIEREERGDVNALSEGGASPLHDQSPPVRRPPAPTPTATPRSKWMDRCGEWVRQAEQIHKTDPFGAIKGLTAAANYLLELAQTVCARDPESRAMLPALHLAGNTCAMAGGIQACETGGADASGSDVIFAALIAAARAMTAVDDFDGAKVAIHEAEDRLQKFKKAISKADTSQSQAACGMANLLLEVKARFFFHQGERYVGSFGQHCDQAKRLQPYARRRECETAAGELRKAVECAVKIERAYNDMGKPFIDSPFESSVRKWKEVLNQCRADRGI